ncbi:Clp protease N-terminal domain-containing protein [Arthrobacter wenxiniae]
MSQNYTDGARRAVVLAQEEARAMMHDSYIGPEHLLLGLLHAYPNTVQTVAGRLAG